VHRLCFDRAVKASPTGKRGVIAEEFTLDSKLCCKSCGMRVRRHDLAYSGLLYHDLRRSFARDALRAGIPESIARRLGGWLTKSVFNRYALVDDEDDVRMAMEKYQIKQKADVEALRETAAEALIRSSLEAGESEAKNVASEAGKSKLQRVN
jgi:hypothetical protein